MANKGVLNVKVIGADALHKKFVALGKDAEKVFAETTRLGAINIQENAIRLAPKDLGALRNSIRHQKTDADGLRYLIYADNNIAPYAPYMEFGTGSKNVIIPKGWETMAAQFKGKDPNRGNITPRPFMYPSFIEGGRWYIKQLKRAIKHLEL